MSCCYLCTEYNDTLRMCKGSMATCDICKNTVHMYETMICYHPDHRNHRLVCDRCYLKNECM